MMMSKAGSHCTCATNNVDYMYKKTKSFVRDIPKEVRFRATTTDEIRPHYNKDVPYLIKPNFRPADPEYTFVICEDTGSTVQLMPGMFWNFVDNGDWGSQLRVCEGPLLEIIFRALHDLLEENILDSYVVTHFDVFQKKAISNASKNTPSIGPGRYVDVPVKVKISYFMLGMNYITSFTKCSPRASCVLDSKLDRHITWLEDLQLYANNPDDETVSGEYAPMYTNIVEKQESALYHIDQRVNERGSFLRRFEPTEQGERGEHLKKDLGVITEVPSDVQPPTVEPCHDNTPPATLNLHLKHDRKKVLHKSLTDDHQQDKGSLTSTEITEKAEIINDTFSVFSVNQVDSSVMNLPNRKNVSKHPRGYTSITTIHQRVRENKPSDPCEKVLPTVEQNPYGIIPSFSNINRPFIRRSRRQPDGNADADKDRALTINCTLPSVANNEPFNIKKLNREWSKTRLQQLKENKEARKMESNNNYLWTYHTTSPPKDQHFESSLPPIVPLGQRQSKKIELKPQPYVNREPSLPKLSKEDLPVITNAFENIHMNDFKGNLVNSCKNFLVRKELVVAAEDRGEFKAFYCLVINRARSGSDHQKQPCRKCHGKVWRQNPVTDSAQSQTLSKSQNPSAQSQTLSKSQNPSKSQTQSKSQTPFKSSNSRVTISSTIDNLSVYTIQEF